MDDKRVDYRAWFVRVLAWDGALPTAIASAPFVVEPLFPRRRGTIEITSVVLPIVAFLLRCVFGSRHIVANHCGEVMKRVQMGVLFVAIIPLVLVDALLVLTHLMPKGALSHNNLLILEVIVLVYLVLMTFAMYPGRGLPPQPVEDDPWRMSAFPD